MSVQFKTPNITGATDREKLVQIQSYLYQMAKQLQWAFDNIGTSGTVSSQIIQNTEVGGKTDTKSNAETFNGLKNLIIKSADIVNAYYSQINRRLEGVYVAQSDFGTYSENTSLNIQENSNSINQIYSNLRSISDTVDTLYNASIRSNAYLKTGLLYEDEDGVPVYGLEIGQTNNINGEDVFDKFARFSADRLSFFDRNDVEVAYISDYKLYITNAEITGSLEICGRFKVYFSNGLAFQWIGGES